MFVYHGTNKENPVLTEPTNIKAMDNLGIWFSTSSEYAGWFGKNLFKFEEPKGKFYEPEDHKFHRVFYNEEVFSKLYGSEELASLITELTKAPSTGGMTRFLPTKKSGRIRSLTKKAKIPGVKGTHMHELFREAVLINTPYLEAFRDHLKKQGYDGIFFKDSKIDGVDHDVWMVFNPSKIGMKPIAESALVVAALKKIILRE